MGPHICLPEIFERLSLYALILPSHLKFVQITCPCEGPLRGRTAVAYLPNRCQINTGRESKVSVGMSELAMEGEGQAGTTCVSPCIALWIQSE